jgi:protein-tyrosine phosphatase
VAVRLLFVCMGNICRSPTAEGVMRGLVRDAGLAGEIEVESAGTGDWHIGHPPDPRATAAAAGRGLVLDGTARQVTREDLRDFDLVLAADRDNRAALLALAGDDERARGRIRLLREFDPASAGAPDLDVPDPYFGGEDGFDHVLDLVEAACRGLLDHARSELPPR